MLEEFQDAEGSAMQTSPTVGPKSQSRLALAFCAACFACVPTAMTAPQDSGPPADFVERVDTAKIDDTRLLWMAMTAIRSFDERQDSLVTPLLSQTIGVAGPEIAAVAHEAKAALEQIKEDFAHLTAVRCQEIAARPTSNEEVAAFFEALDRDHEAAQERGVHRFITKVSTEARAKILAWAREKLLPSAFGTRINYRKFFARADSDALAVFDRVCKPASKK